MSIEQTATVEHQKGLHARPATVFVQTASEFDSTIEVNSNGSSADAKSSLEIMSIGVGAGQDIVISAEGDDAEQAVKTLTQLVENDFEK